MVFKHRMLNRANLNLYAAWDFFYNRNVLFLGCINSVFSL